MQVVWVKLANLSPSSSLPNADADAYHLITQWEDVLTVLKTRYPNLKQVFVAPRTYGGYGTTPRSPEPYAYESGFGAQQFILNHFGETSPFVDWGPYLWADGVIPRSDGLVWLREDFEDDGVHPSALGEAKVADMLQAFFQTSPATTWFPK